MFERFRRSRERDHNNGDGVAFQRGDGYGDGRTSVAADRTAVAGDRTAVADDRTADAGDRTSADDRVGDSRTAVVDDRTAVGRRRDVEDDRHATTRTATTASGATTLAEARAIQRDRFGGADGTAIFFGWLSALGLAALLTAVLAAAGTRLGFATGVETGDATANAETIGIVGAALLVGVLLLAYYGGGYVAGRMARFDGGRQGFRVWLLGLLVTIALAVAGWVGGSEYNVLSQLNLPRIPVEEGDVATGALVTLAVVLFGTLLAAVAGGKAGDRYHARVDRHGWGDDRV